MRRTIMIFAATAAIALLPGCAGGPERVNGRAEPAGLVSPTPSAPAPVRTPSATPPSSTPPATQTTRSRTPETPVFGPTGWDGLRIGMTVKAANATGRISAPVRPGCGTAPMKGAARGTEDVIFSSGKGLILIPAYGDAATPEGIRVGSTFARLTRAYPDFSAHLEGEEFTGTGTVFGGKEDGHPGVHYRFDVRDNKVARMALEHDHQDCYE